MPMKIAASSQTALLAVAGILVIAGSMMLSPEGMLLTLAVAGVLAVLVSFSSSSRIRRVIALIILAVAALQAIPAWQRHRSLFDRYRETAHPSDTHETRK